MKKMNWSIEEKELCVKLHLEGKSNGEIRKYLNRSDLSIYKKLYSMGYPSNYVKNKQGVTKYKEYNWVEIQKDYNNGLSTRALSIKYKLTPQSINWGKVNNYLILRSKSNAAKMSHKINPRGKKVGIQKYRQECQFNFSLNLYPDEFDFKLIDKFGWYSATNKGDNKNGISRDHMYSIKEGFKNNINSDIIKHPANCKLMLQFENNCKKTNCSITIEELLIRIEKWDIKYK